jgi:cytochrome c peroxidase
VAPLLRGATPQGELKSDEALDWQVPNPRVQLPFEQDIPIVFINRSQNFAEWKQLKGFWNVAEEKALHPLKGEFVTRKVIKVKVPLGLSQNPPVPAENPITLARWELGRQLYYDTILSSDETISCSSCHSPKHGFTDRSPVSTGIGGNKGGVSAPSVMNAAYNALQFWDGRAVSLEDQAQGPVQNPMEMTSGKGHAWNAAVLRVRGKGTYHKEFLAAFGTPPTRDAIAKAIASFERTVLVGNAIHDRAEVAMRLRVSEEGGTKFEAAAADYEKVLKEAVAARDTAALSALKFDPARDMGRLGDLAKSLANGRVLFFGKARCSTCHVGDNFTDNNFHNLGVGARDGKLPKGGQGRFGAQMTGHKSYDMMGAFKTPMLRGLLSTDPYMHDGSEKTLEEVVEFYNRGGNANPFLDGKLRDQAAEKAYVDSLANKTVYKGPKAYDFGPGQVVVPLALNLTAQEKADLVLFLRALQSDPPDPLVADPGRKAPR